MMVGQALCNRPGLAPGNRTRRRFLAATAAFLSTATARSSVTGPGLFPASGKSFRWLAFYGPTADEAVLTGYDVVVLDAAFQGSISQVAAAGTRVCGYLSLGEIRNADPFFEHLDRVALLPENPDWPGTHRVDIRSASWRSLVLDLQIPSLVAQGFTGFMLDTLDTPPYVEVTDPPRFRGMREAAIGLVASIRERWPNMMLIMNRGYALLPDVLGKIDALIAESFLTSPDTRTGGFAWVDPDQVELQLALLKPATRRRPPLPILSLDYWDPDDPLTIAEIYRRERELGHHPYVATRSLDQIVPEHR
jgi:polysaccharide biosynthesis protein PelA